MNTRAFLAVVPRAIVTTAIVVGTSLTVAGVIGGALVANPKHLVGPIGLYWIAALVMGALSSLWLLAIGYVYADARLRGTRAGLWAAVVILMPHLFGFLLYFVMRPPLLSSCTQCGMAIAPDSDFCSFCGSLQLRRPITHNSHSSAVSIGDPS